jgi:hypothetical protein
MNALPIPTSGGSPDSDPTGPGITVERRTLLWLPLAAAGGGWLAGGPLSAAEREAQEGGSFSALTHEEFGRRWQALAQELLPLPPEHDESYAAQLAGLVARLPVAALPPLVEPRRASGFMAGPTWFLKPCAMIEFRMDAGAVLRLHNHPPQVVLTLCAEGEVAYRHFEIEGEAPPCTEIDGAFHARETRAGILRASRTTALTRARDGIHGFTAGKQGARIVDFTVATTADVETFSYIELSPEPVDPERRVYEAIWLGK